ncbi:hypothetical protein COCCADRAFT_112070 [Bipolaris zeicola 26-R-13]|uniref:Uncharacterized protein n=1 Tax=Cochliobolus carbonum (strain 26-R-13) TaxID=930089 RepID=W6XP77_COCC2|nr:uncharacterized protein COCCADRAFT_112070 [Bipolaris zeicola 26-R-13]EUC27303.1 hypothetical protein COCCADRAFT_112070 [Bipolaris zeicola 26-R-13]
MLSVTCQCSGRFKNHNKIHGHECQRAFYEQQVNARSITLNLTWYSELNQGAGPTLATEKRPIPPAEATAQKILCPCGQSFKNEKKLGNHLRYSKTHQAEKLGSGSTPKSTTPDSVPFTVSHSPSTTISPALWPVSTTILSSPEKVSQVHKRDCLYYRRQADKSLTRSQQQNDSLVSSFASLRLDPVLAQAQPLVASFACICGSTFTGQKALEKHKVEKRQLAWPEKGEKRKDVFKTPRPQYHEDEYLRDMCEALARQSYGGG